MKSFVEIGLEIHRLPLLETLMSSGNGYMGSRGYLEEFEYPGSIRGNYINGIYERIPMEHAEWAYAFPLQTDRMPNLLDLFNITIYLDEEEVVIYGDISDFIRELNFEDGVNRRSYKYKAQNNKVAEIKFEKLISFAHVNLKTWTIEIDFPGKIEVRNDINFNISNMVNPNDPRNASKNIQLIKVIDSSYSHNDGNIRLRTINSGIDIEMTFRDSGNYDSSWHMKDDVLSITYLSSGNLKLNRMVKYFDSIRNINTEFVNNDELYSGQRDYLKNFNLSSSIDFLDNKELDNAIEFMKFHLLQSTTQDTYGNIAAKGLSGEGYEGHYFWDTEIFLFPVWLMWDSNRARNLLLYRYGLLDSARSRALELGHQRGACFSWRSISGLESSGYFPAGTAQYHLNFDIAYTFVQWWLENKDIDFVVNYSMELLIETARTVLEIGCFEPDGFHIHTVTGPDEYTALVSDNYFTNKMAQYNLKWAIKLWNLLKRDRKNDYLELKERLNVTDEEIRDMEMAGEQMILLYDEKLGIIAQDSSFLQKAKWPKENDLRPLLLNYHPLTIYRYQVIKQADALLAQYLLGDLDEEVTRRSFYYYEDINTYDSSLSKCVSCLIATRLKDEDLAYDLFMDTVYFDFKDLHNNTRDGLHMANIGGSLLSVIKGFGGLTIKEDNLHINPYLPRKLGRLKFRFTWRNTLLEFFVQGEDVSIKKISGPNTLVILKGKELMIGEKAVLFDLDGVLTGTSDNHYEGWARLMKDLGHELPVEFKDKLRGISRMDSLDAILEHFNLDYTLEEKYKLADIKNRYYIESIESFSPENLYEGVVDLLDRLKSNGVKIGLVSASKNALGLIKSMEIEKYFDGVVDPQSVENGKPHPDLFIKAAELLKVDPKQCLGVEDAKAGIQSINAAGMTSVGIGDEDLAEADYKYGTILEACEFITKWVEG